MLKKKRCWGFVSGVLLIALVGSTAMATIAQENHGRIEKRQQRSNAPVDTERGEPGLSYLGGLFQGINIRSPLGDEFNTLYLRNKAEIHQIIDRNPGIVWETVELALDLLPALRTVDRNGGKLSVEKKLYGRATGLFGKCESLASPQLAGDLKRAKALVESRATELDSQQLLIDLNE